mmetsp:Transcript_8755/g.14382  ORF Transcript_8755/g.14382 Transcript_8755/m.14382 type:complete len:102 (+) Transcript_8755:2410-2715(+)
MLEVVPRDDPESMFVIDATALGNVARFFNHSCSPNMRTHQIYVPPAPYPHIGFFALRDIEIGEELTFDYAGGANVLPTTHASTSASCICLCDTPNCRMILE